MKHVIQKDEMGCLLAAAAMVLDLDYDEVKKTAPLPDLAAFQLEGTNHLGGWAFDEIQRLAKERGKQFDDIPLPFTCQKGMRYIALLPSTDSMLHAVAIDEYGRVFDPAGTSTSRGYSEYEFTAMLGCFPLRE